MKKPIKIIGITIFLLVIVILGVFYHTVSKSRIIEEATTEEIRTEIENYVKMITSEEVEPSEFRIVRMWDSTTFFARFDNVDNINTFLKDDFRMTHKLDYSTESEEKQLMKQMMEISFLLYFHAAPEWIKEIGNFEGYECFKTRKTNSISINVLYAIPQEKVYVCLGKL